MVGLREVAEADNRRILGDTDTGFAWLITITAPDGTVSVDLTGFSDDISQLIDPDTGQAVSGRLISIAVNIGAFLIALPGKGLPVGIADATSKPWLVTFDDINGNAYTFKVLQSNPDRMMGGFVCLLEFYE